MRYLCSLLVMILAAVGTHAQDIDLLLNAGGLVPYGKGRDSKGCFITQAGFDASAQHFKKPVYVSYGMRLGYLQTSDHYGSSSDDYYEYYQSGFLQLEALIGLHVNMPVNKHTDFTIATYLGSSYNAQLDDGAPYYQYVSAKTELALGLMFDKRMTVEAKYAYYSPLMSVDEGLFDSERFSSLHSLCLQLKLWLPSHRGEERILSSTDKD